MLCIFPRDASAKVLLSGMRLLWIRSPVATLSKLQYYTSNLLIYLCLILSLWFSVYKSHVVIFNFSSRLIVLSSNQVRIVTWIWNILITYLFLIYIAVRRLPHILMYMRDTFHFICISLWCVDMCKGDRIQSLKCFILYFRSHILFLYNVENRLLLNFLFVGGLADLLLTRFCFFFVFVSL